MPARRIQDLLAVRQVSEDVFESVVPPEAQGNARAIAYGGCALGVACMAAHQGVPEHHRIYSMTGYYLGPAQTDRVFTCRTQTIRSTRTFTTKQVTLSQKLDDSRQRDCLITTVDFHTIEPANLMTFTTPPPAIALTPDECPPMAEWRTAQVKQGRMTQQAADTHAVVFGLGLRLFENRQCPESMGAQTMYGLADPSLPAAQDELPLHERQSCDWWRTRTPLSSSRAEHAAALAFQMDRALSFMALANSKRWLSEAGAASSLDFAMRYLVNDFDLAEWHLSSMCSLAADAGRSYGEGRTWDQAGRMIASMTQSSILRPKKPKL